MHQVSIFALFLFLWFRKNVYVQIINQQELNNRTVKQNIILINSGEAKGDNSNCELKKKVSGLEESCMSLETVAALNSLLSSLQPRNGLHARTQGKLGKERASFWQLSVC